MFGSFSKTQCFLSKLISNRLDVGYLKRTNIEQLFGNNAVRSFNTEAQKGSLQEPKQPAERIQMAMHCLVSDKSLLINHPESLSVIPFICHWLKWKSLKESSSRLYKSLRFCRCLDEYIHRFTNAHIFMFREGFVSLTGHRAGNFRLHSVHMVGVIPK